MNNETHPAKFTPIHLITEGVVPADLMITRTLLESTWTGEYYKCPRCKYQTLDQALMLSHLRDLINLCINTIYDMAKAPRPGQNRTD